MRRHAAWLMLRSVAIVSILLSMTLGVGLSITPDGGLYLNSEIVSAAGEGWLGSWESRIKIYIDYSKISTELTNFPVLVYISGDSGTNSYDLTAVFDELGSDNNRRKIAITTDNGESQCYVEIEKWDDANEQAWLWVKVPVVNHGANTILYLYYDVDQPDNTAYVGDTGSTPARNVWDSNYVAVYHGQTQLDGTVNEYVDSTSNAHNGVAGDGLGTAVIDGAYYSYGGYNSQSLCGNTWLYQTFTPTETATATHVKLFLYAHDIGEDVEVAIRATSGGKPIGSDLASGSVNSDYIRHNTLDIVDFDLGEGVELTAGTQYALIIRSPNATSATYVSTFYDATGSYAGGEFGYSSNGGDSWNKFSGTLDLNFEIRCDGNTEAAPILVENGAYGYEQYLDGYDDYIEIPADDDFCLLTTDELTIQVSLAPATLTFTNNGTYPHSNYGYVNFLGKGAPSAYEYVFTIKDEAINGTPEPCFYIHNADGGLGTGGGTFTYYNPDDRIFCTGRLSDVTKLVNLRTWYPDDVVEEDEENYTEWGGLEIIPENTESPFRIGSWILRNQWYEGVVGELRISSIWRGNAWIDADNYSISDDLLSYSTGEDIVSSLQVQYATGDDKNVTSSHNTWYAQTFTTSNAFHVTSVKVKIYAYNTPDAAAIHIRAVDGTGKPTGSDLCSGAIDIGSLVGSPGTWIEVDMGIGADLAANTQYAIILTENSSTSGVSWRADSSSPAYAGGRMGESFNGGSSWIMYSSYDLMFEVWGGGGSSPPSGDYDLNGDGSVNVLDMIRVGQHQGESGQPGWIPEDVNEDGAVNVLDMVLIGQHWTG